MRRLLPALLLSTGCLGSLDPMQSTAEDTPDVAVSPDATPQDDASPDLEEPSLLDMEAAEDMPSELIEDMEQDAADSPPIEPGPCNPAIAERGAYEPDPEIVSRLERLTPNQSMLFPLPNVDNQGVTVYGSQKGPPHRDFSNAMAFVPTRHTALYAGGSHGTYRGNDVWEYHLGSNTWHILFKPEGGNPGPYTASVFALNHKYARDKPIPADLRPKVDKLKEWARKHLKYENGALTTHQGGPFLPSHQWDGLTYDPHAGRMVWRFGAHQDLAHGAIAETFGLDLQEVIDQRDRTLTLMWTFDPEARTWQRYAHPARNTIASMRGMGASATYVSSLCANVHYVAAQNVTPNAFEMWTHDLVTDTWTELEPNGGRSIRQLALEDKVSPGSEVQMAYSARHDKLVAVLEDRVYVYDIQANTWEHVLTDDRVNARGNLSIFDYDSKNDVFLLFTKDKPKRVAAYSLQTNAWDMRTVDGPTFPKPPWGGHMGYYDPQYNALVIAGATQQARAWVYRYE